MTTVFYVFFLPSLVIEYHHSLAQFSAVTSRKSRAYTIAFSNRLIISDFHRNYPSLRDFSAARERERKRDYTVVSVVKRCAEAGATESQESGVEKWCSFLVKRYRHFQYRSIYRYENNNSERRREVNAK